MQIGSQRARLHSCGQAWFGPLLIAMRFTLLDPILRAFDYLHEGRCMELRSMRTDSVMWGIAAGEGLGEPYAVWQNCSA